MLKKRKQNQIKENQNPLCNSCAYRMFIDGQNCCYYIVIEEKRRGCSPINCEKYIKGKPRRQWNDSTYFAQNVQKEEERENCFNQE